MPLHHVVLFKLAGDVGTSGERIDPLLRALVETAPGVLTGETQADAGLRPGNPRSYQRLLHVTFAGADDFRAYLECAEHVAFLAAAKDLIETIASIQYEGA
jgi:hypothetical protein